MPKRVQLPDGNIGQFPDTMSDQQIEAVLQKQFPAPTAPPTLNQRLTTPNSPDYAKNHPVLSAVQDFGKGALATGEQVVTHPVKSAESTISTLDDVYNADPGTANPTPETLAARGRLKQQWDEAKAHPAFTAGGLAGGLAVGKLAGETPRIVPKAFRSGLTALTNTGTRNVEDLVEKTKEGNAAEVAKTADKNADQAAKRAKDLKAHHAKTEDVKAANEVAQAAASKKEALNRGVEQLDQEFQENLKQTAKDVKTQADAKYQTVRDALGPKKDAAGEPIPGSAPTIPSSELASAVKAAETKIEGSSENLKIFRDILSKHPEDDPDFVKYQGADIPKGHALYDVLKEQGAVGADHPATFTDLQGYYTELGDKLSGGGLQGDVYQAMKSLHESIGTIMQKMADDHKVGPQLKDAQTYYADYMKTFRDPNAPLYKAIKAPERGDSIKALKGKDRTGIEALAKYNPELARTANTVRSYQSEAGKISTKAPIAKPLPKLPAKPEPIKPDLKTIGPEDISGAKAKGMKSRVQMIRRRGEWIATGAAGYGVLENALRGDYGRIPRMLIEGGMAVATVAGIASLLEKPEFVEALTKATPKDVERIPPELRRNLGPVIQAAKSKGIHVSPSFAALATSGATLQHPVLSKQSPVQPSQ